MDARAAKEHRVPRPLTPMQLAIWTGQKLQPGVPLYNMSHTFRIRGDIDPDRFLCAFELLVAGTDVLRAVIDERDDSRPMLVISDYVLQKHRYTDLSGASDPGAQLDAIVAEQLNHRFVPGEPLYESHLVKTGAEDYTWCFTLHHLIGDFTSVTLLFNRISDSYRDLDRNTSWPDFESFMDWTSEQRESPRAKRAAAYWERHATSSDDPAVELFGNRLSGSNPRSVRVALPLGQERSRRLRELAAEAPFRGLTQDLGVLNVFTTLLWAFLFRTSNRDTMTLGAPLHNRSTAEFRDTAGLLINILPMTTRRDDGETFGTLAAKVGLATLDATKYAAFAAEESHMRRGFDAVINFLTGTVGDFSGMPCDFRWEHAGYADPHHALRLQIQDFSDTGAYTLYLDINEDLLQGLERHRVADAFLRLVDACVESTDAEIVKVGILPAEDRKRLVTQFNDTQRQRTDAATLLDLLQPVWQESADETAILFRDETWTYRELDQRSNAIAGEMTAIGVAHGDIVAICLPRSPDFVAAILATLRLGAAYLPVDPAQPVRRVQRILDDASPRLILVSEDGALPPGYDTLAVTTCDTAAQPPTAVEVGCSDPAYVIYTSGSTGNPKGVVVEHKGIVNYIAWAIDQYVDQPGLSRPSMPLYSSVAVDLTLTSIFLPLATAGRIVIYEAEDARNDLAILDVFRSDEVDILKLTPAHLSLLHGLNLKATNIGTLILGGENLTSAAAHAAQSLFPNGVAVFNEYGPTETVVGCMIHRYDHASDTGLSVPIGAPIDNMRAYALDRHGMPVLPGAIGELHIAGVGVARGYHASDELTERAFVTLSEVGEQRAYKTGDRVRFGGDGLMTYLGRNDDQVKIRGNRIELGEIEARLQSHPQVTGAVVAAITKSESGHAHRTAGEAQQLCSRCGLPDNYPGAGIDPETGICELCRQYDRYKDRIDGYFRERDELRALVADIVATQGDGPGAIALTSGGKDSVYSLHQLARMGLKPIVFTLDNGYISDQALDNVRRVASQLDLELVIGRTPHMNAIFADSLERHCNVCNGCFKTIYTLSINLAIERGINYIFTGLSRGQLFETRLAPAMFAGKHYSEESIERDIAAARIAYHRRHDAVNERLDVRAFGDDTLFDRIKFVDFYRYWDIGLSELYDYLERQADWVRPSDTGRSTNCKINEAGISVHKGQRGYHNYALPYSWDVRLGHKERSQALHELNDEIDAENVARMLQEVGHTPSAGSAEAQLVAAYTSDKGIEPAQVREYLEQELPSYMIPNQLLGVDDLPLTSSGKLDRARLDSLGTPGERRSDSTQARNEVEQAVARIWSETLGINEIGVHENFFDLGGTSLPALQIVARCGQLFDIEVPLADFFAQPSIAGLAAAVEAQVLDEIESLSDEEAESALQALEKGE